MAVEVILSLKNVLSADETRTAKETSVLRNWCLFLTWCLVYEILYIHTEWKQRVKVVLATSSSHEGLDEEEKHEIPHPMIVNHSFFATLLPGLALSWSSWFSFLGWSHDPPPASCLMSHPKLCCFFERYLTKTRRNEWLWRSWDDISSPCYSLPGDSIPLSWREIPGFNEWMNERESKDNNLFNPAVDSHSRQDPLGIFGIKTDFLNFLCNEWEWECDMNQRRFPSVTSVTKIRSEGRELNKEIKRKVKDKRQDVG